MTERASALETAGMMEARKLVEQLAGRVSEQVTMKTMAEQVPEQSPEQLPEQLPEQSPEQLLEQAAELMTSKAAESAAAAEVVPGRVTGAAAVMVTQTVTVTEAGADVEKMTEAGPVRMTAAVSESEAGVVVVAVSDDAHVMVVTMTVTDAQQAEIGRVTGLDCANKGGLTGVAAWEGCASVAMTSALAD